MVKRGYLLLITGLLLGLALASLFARVYGSQATTSSITRPESIDLVFLYTSEKECWINTIKPLFEEYFYEKYGIHLNLVPYVTGSHESVSLMLSGSVRPDVWSPASSIWIPYLESKWKNIRGNSIVGSWYPVVLSPIVIAGWSHLVEEYRVSTFRDLYTLAKLGIDFKYGHTDPMLSNSGLMALLLEFCEAANKTPSQLTVEDIRNPIVLEFVKTIEQKAVYYGKSTGFFGDWAAENGPSAITFFTAYENVVISSSAKSRAKWEASLSAVYTPYGILYSDHPLVLIEAPWVDDWKRLAAREFLIFLLQPQSQEKAQEYGFRPVNPLVPINARIFNPDNGVIEKIPYPALNPPKGEVLEAVLDAWIEVRNPGV